MKEFKVVWQIQPHVYHPLKIMFVEAVDEQSAKAVAVDHLHRTTGEVRISIHSVCEYVKPTCGRVL